MSVVAVDMNGVEVTFDCGSWEIMDKTDWTLLETDCGGRVHNYGRPFAHGEDRATTTGTGDKHFHYVQSSPSATWVIVHNLGKYPAVLVRDSAGTIIEGEYTYNSQNQITLNFSAAFSGFAELN